MPFRESLTAEQQLQSLREAIDSASARFSALDTRTLDWQTRLAQIASPTGAEQKRADAVGYALRAMGCDTMTDNVGNVVAIGTQYVTRTTESKAETQNAAPIVCMAHLDTVFDENTSLHCATDGSRIHCPGIGDNSRGLATMLTIAHVLHERRPRPVGRPVEFVATVGEEGLGNLRGARAYFENRAANGQPTPHAVLVLDGPGDQNIVHHALGSRRFRITFRGAGGHSWADFGAPNAIHAASRSAAWLADAPRTIGGRVAITVSRIGGGESMNAIPSHAWFDVDIRAMDKALLIRAERELREIVKEATANEADSASTMHRQFAPASAAFHSDVSLLGERPCGALSHEHSLVQLANAATEWFGIDPVSAVASTDANIPLSLGIPAVTIGGGGSGGAAHTVNEWYDNTHGPRGVARAYAILRALTA